MDKCIENTYDMETTIITDMSREKAKIKFTITKVPAQLRNLDTFLVHNASTFLIANTLIMYNLVKVVQLPPPAYSE